MISTPSLEDRPFAATAARSITSVAVRTVQIERAEAFQCRSEVALSQALFQHDQSRLLHAQSVTASVRGFVLEDVVLDSDSLLICKDGALISETAAMAPPDGRQPFADPGIPLEDADDVDVVLGFNAAHFRYQNWLTQCLPAIDWCLRQLADRPVRLLLPPLTPWQEEFLRLLGYDHVPRITVEPGTRYRIGRLHFAEFLTGVHSASVSLTLRQTMERIVAAVPQTGPTKPVLYVPGTHYDYGALRNEADLVSMMSRVGAGIILPTLSVPARINLFRNAQVVIGPLSHGLTDVVFCRPGSLLWELMPRHHLDPTVNRLVQAGRIDYLADVFPVAAGPVVAGDWQVEFPLVQQRLQQINERLQRIAAARAQASAAPQVAPVATPVAAPAPPPAPAQPSPAAAHHEEPATAETHTFECLGDGSLAWLAQPRDPSAPRSLLQIARFSGPPESRLEKLVAALEQGFEGLGAPGTITIDVEEEDGRRMLVAHDATYGLRVSTGVPEGAADPERLAGEVGNRLSFLGRTLLDSMLAGDVVWVWHSEAATHPAHIQPLLRALRRLGPNVLLWVTAADANRPAGTVEPLEDDCLRGYLAPAQDGGYDPESWHRVRAMADRWLDAQSTDGGEEPFGPFAPMGESQADAAPEPAADADAEALTVVEAEAAGVEVLEAPAEAYAGTEEGTVYEEAAGDAAVADAEGSPSTGLVVAPADAEPAAERQDAPLSAMEYLARNPAVAAPPPPPRKRSFLGRLFGRS